MKPRCWANILICEICKCKQAWIPRYYFILFGAYFRLTTDGHTFGKSSFNVIGEFCGFKFACDKLCRCCEWQCNYFLFVRKLVKQCTTDRSITYFRACKVISVQASSCKQCPKPWYQRQRQIDEILAPCTNTTSEASRGAERLFAWLTATKYIHLHEANGLC